MTALIEISIGEAAVHRNAEMPEGEFPMRAFSGRSRYYIMKVLTRKTILGSTGTLVYNNLVPLAIL